MFYYFQIQLTKATLNLSGQFKNLIHHEMPFFPFSTNEETFFFRFQHVTHALSGFSRLSHGKCSHTKQESRKSFSPRDLDRRFISDFDFYCYSFVVWRQERNLNQTVLCYFSFSACALSELYEGKIFFLDYFSLFTEAFNTSSENSRRRKTQLHDNVTQCRCGHETESAKKIRISSYFAYEATAEKIDWFFGSGWIMCCLTFEPSLCRRHAWQWDELLMFFHRIFMYA